MSFATIKNSSCLLRGLLFTFCLTGNTENTLKITETQTFSAFLYLFFIIKRKKYIYSAMASYFFNAKIKQTLHCCLQKKNELSLAVLNHLI